MVQNLESVKKLSEPGMSPAKSRIRIILVEDHVVLRDGFRVVLETEPEFHVVGEFGSAEQCLEGMGGLRPDVVVVDLGLPGRSGIELVSQIQLLSPSTRCLMLTAHGSPESIRAALNAGAGGYILKDSNVSELMLGIRAVSRGERYLCKVAAGSIVRGFLSGDTAGKPSTTLPAVPSITQREREVLTRVALGSSNKVIAREFGVSPKTVEKHRAKLMKKLKLHSAAALTIFAAANGLTDLAAVPGLPPPVRE